MEEEQERGTGKTTDALIRCLEALMTKGGCDVVYLCPSMNVLEHSMYLFVEIMQRIEDQQGYGTSFIDMRQRTRSMNQRRFTIMGRDFIFAIPDEDLPRHVRECCYWETDHSVWDSKWDSIVINNIEQCEQYLTHCVDRWKQPAGYKYLQESTTACPHQDSLSVNSFQTLKYMKIRRSDGNLYNVNYTA